MKLRIHTLLLLLLAISGIFYVSCKGGGKEKRKEINLWVSPKAKKIDTAVRKLYENQYYLPAVVRLKPGSNAFIMVDSVQDASLKRTLTQAEREDFYKKAVATVSKKDIDAYEHLWQIPELKKMQSGDGGYGTIFASITQRPVPDTPYYIIEIRKNHIQEFPLHDTIGYVKFSVLSNDIWFADNSGYYVPVKAFRAAKK